MTNLSVYLCWAVSLVAFAVSMRTLVLSRELRAAIGRSNAAFQRLTDVELLAAIEIVKSYMETIEYQRQSARGPQNAPAILVKLNQIREERKPKTP